MKFELKENSGVVEILLPLCNLFPERSLELMNLCLKSKRGVHIDVKSIKKSRTSMQEGITGNGVASSLSLWA